MKKFIIALLLIPSLALSNPPLTYSGSTTAQFFPTIVKALLGNGFALVPAQSLVGDCSDGNVTISSGTTTLSRDMFYNNLTISGTGILSIQNQRVYVCGTLDVTAAPSGAITAKGNNGNNASGATAGTAGTATGAGTNIANRVGGGGGAGGTAAGTAGGVGNGGNALAGTTTTGSGASSGGGGAGSGGAGGNGRPRVTVTAWPMRDILTWFLPLTGSAGAVFSAGSGPGGGGGGGDATNSGGGGGGGGASGSSIWLSANIIKTSVSTPASVITAAGGNGGNGANGVAGNSGGGGGGGGGSGGWVVIKWNSRSGPTISSAINALGGTGGTAGAGTGTGAAGTAGNVTPSLPGLIQTLDYSTGSITTSLTGSADL